jgi:hypothetical protein
MSQGAARYRYWKIALQVAMVIGGVYTIYNVVRHWYPAQTFNSDLLYIGGISCATCTVPVFFVAWILLALFGKGLVPTATE